MSKSVWPARLGSLWLAALVAGCGGGGGDSPAPEGNAATPAPVPSPSPAPSPAPAPTPAPPPSSVDASCGLSDFAASVLARVNQLRAAGADCGTRGSFAPAGPLTWSMQLTAAATGHSTDMVTNDFFSHTGSGGSTLTSRVDATGYGWSALGENIAAGPMTVNAVMDGWMASDGHCANIMNPDFTQIGQACVPGSSSTTYRSYWTMNLARPR